MKFQIDISHQQALNEFARKLSLLLNQGVVYLYGNLGVGKTTFVKYFLKNLGYEGIVTSPSYGLINIYSVSANKNILHADLYRLVQPEELLYLDVDEWLDMADILLIEWPAKGFGFLPKPDYELEFILKEQQRNLILTAHFSLDFASEFKILD